MQALFCAIECTYNNEPTVACRRVVFCDIFTFSLAPTFTDRCQKVKLPRDDISSAKSEALRHLCEGPVSMFSWFLRFIFGRQFVQYTRNLSNALFGK